MDSRHRIWFEITRKIVRTKKGKDVKPLFVALVRKLVSAVTRIYIPFMNNPVWFNLFSSLWNPRKRELSCHVSSHSKESIFNHPPLANNTGGIDFHRLYSLYTSPYQYSSFLLKARTTVHIKRFKKTLCAEGLNVTWIFLKLIFPLAWAFHWIMCGVWLHLCFNLRFPHIS